MDKERIKEQFKDLSLGHMIIVLIIVAAILALCGVAFYFLGILLPIALWQTGHLVLAVLQFYIAFTSLLYGGKSK